MTRRETMGWTRLGLSLLASLLLVAMTGAVWAGPDEDLQRAINRERRSLDDLRGLDQLRAASEDIALLKVWLDEAWTLRGEGEYERANDVLERVDAQKDMVREKITASLMKAEAARYEAKVKEGRARIKALEKEIRELGKKKTGFGEKTE